MLNAQVLNQTSGGPVCRFTELIVQLSKKARSDSLTVKGRIGPLTTICQKNSKKIPGKKYIGNE